MPSDVSGDIVALDQETDSIPDDPEDWDDDEDYEEMPKVTSVSNVTEGIDALRDKILSGKTTDRIRHGIVVENLDTSSLDFVWKENRPCYGELRRYGELSTRPQDHKPGDLTQPIDFKYSTKAVGIPFLLTTNNHYAVPPLKMGSDDISESFELLVEMFYNPAGPYKSLLEGSEIVRDADGVARGVICTGSIDPTLFVAAGIGARCLGYHQICVAAHRKFLKEFSGLPHMQLLLAPFVLTRKKNAYTVNNYEEGVGVNFGHDAGSAYYWQQGQINIKKFLDGEATNLAGGTFEEGRDYNRPYLGWFFNNATAESTVHPEYITNIYPKLTQLFDDLGVKHFTTDTKTFHLDSILEHKDEIVNAVYNWS